MNETKYLFISRIHSMSCRYVKDRRPVPVHTLYGFIGALYKLELYEY